MTSWWAQTWVFTTRNPLLNHNVFHYSRHVLGHPPFEAHPAGCWFQTTLHLEIRRGIPSWRTDEMISRGVVCTTIVFAWLLFGPHHMNYQVINPDIPATPGSYCFWFPQMGRSFDQVIIGEAVDPRTWQTWRTTSCSHGIPSTWCNPSHASLRLQMRSGSLTRIVRIGN